MQDACKYEEAIALFEAVTSGYAGQPAAPYAQIEWALTQARLGEIGKAMDGFSAVMVRFPRYGATALLAVADLQEQAGNSIEASMTLRRLIRSYPVSPEVKTAVVKLASLCGKITASRGGSGTAYSDILVQGECLMDAGKFDDADRLYVETMKKSPPAEWQVELLMAQGRGAVAREKYGAAETAFRRAAKIAPETGQAALARMSIVQGYIDRNMLKDAIRELEAMVRDYPGTSQGVQAQLMAGSCYEAARDRKKAAEAYRKVMAIAPQSGAAAEAQQSMMRLMEAGQ